MINITATLYPHRGDGVLFAGLGNLCGAIGRGCRQTVIRQWLEGNAVHQSNAGSQGNADAGTLPLTQAG